MKLFLPILIALVLPLPAMATEEFIPLQEVAQGQALTGAGLLNESLYVNPAASAFAGVYSVDGTYGLPGEYAASVLDTKTSSIGGALGYFRRPVEIPNQTSAQNFATPLQGVKLALSGKVAQSVAVGIAGKALWGPDLLGNSSKLNDLDLGVLSELGPVQVGAAMRNIFGGNTAMGMGREFSVGARIGYQDLLFLSVATQSTFTDVKPYQYGIGVEYVSPYYFALEGGYRIQPYLGNSYWSAGIGINSPRVSVHYAVMFPNQNPTVEKIEHVFGISVLL